jgi:response regulator RpfG family c-di-GMP phosphodiesterase
MKLAIVIVEDEPGVRDALERDLAPFRDKVRVEAASDVADARVVLDDLAADGDRLALVLADHRLPGETGVEFLVRLHDDPATASVRKVLVTGQADQDDTIRAVNRAGLHHYIAKPWDPDELGEVVREQLTAYVVDEGIDPLPHLSVLDAATVLPLLRDRGDR